MVPSVLAPSCQMGIMEQVTEEDHAGPAIGTPGLLLLKHFRIERLLFLRKDNILRVVSKTTGMSSTTQLSDSATSLTHRAPQTGTIHPILLFFP